MACTHVTSASPRANDISWKAWQLLYLHSVHLTAARPSFRG